MKTQKQIHIETMNTLLAREFGVLPCPIKWTGTHRGRFRTNGFWYIMYLGKRCWRELDNTLVHEFAHYLTWRKFGMKEHHGENFRQVLIKVAKAYFGDSSNYAWNTEYKRIQNWYKEGRILQCQDQ